MDSPFVENWDQAPNARGSELEDILGNLCRDYLSTSVSGTHFLASHLSHVILLEVTHGKPLVAKIRPYSHRLAGCAVVQKHLFAAGFPCPPLLLGPVAWNGDAITIEEYLPGETMPPRDKAGEVAGLFFRLLNLSMPTAEVPSLDPPPNWVSWSPSRRALWPRSDESGLDLNRFRGPEWLDAAARKVRQCLKTCDSTVLIGHADWEAQNMRWSGDRIVAVHDWDSVVSQPESALVGQASAVFTANGDRGSEPSVDESEAFITAYEEYRGRAFTIDEREQVWAAGLWVRAFNAKKEAAETSETYNQDRLRNELRQRLACSGTAGR